MKQLARVSVVDAAIEEIRGQIRSGVWKVNDRLPSLTELSTSLGISRAPLREAMRALAHAGLLLAKQGDGTYVTAVDEATVALNRRLGVSQTRELLEVRRGLDMSAVRLATQRRTQADLAAMKKELRRRHDAAELGDRQAFADADTSFHLAVAAAAHNPLLLDLYRGLSSGIRDSVDSAQSLTKAMRGPVDFHGALLKAIRDRSAAVATEVALSIIDDQEGELA